MTEQGVVSGGPELEILETEGVELSDLRRIPLSLIVPGRFQPRRSFDEESLRELAADIQQHGQVEPGILNDRGDGTYELIAGERRYRALKLLGRKTFRAVVVSISDMKLIARLACASNNQREDLSDLDRLETCIALRYTHHFSDGEIAATMGKSVQWVSNTFTLVRLHGKLRPKLGSKQRGGISRSVALQLIRLEPKDQLVVLREARQGKFGEKRVKRLVDERLADGVVSAHPDAQDRRTPTEAFLTLVLGSLHTAEESVRRTYKGSRRKKLKGLEDQDAQRVRSAMEKIRESLSALESVLPVG